MGYIKHIYHISHICSCGELYTHSQGDWEEWKNTCGKKGHKLLNISNKIYDAILKRDERRDQWTN